MDQYDDDVKIGDIRENLMIAFNKLDLYCNLIKAAVKVSGSQCHFLFMAKHDQAGQGFNNDSHSKCDHCHQDLIEYEKLKQYQNTIG
jgi:hypothetical protein